jgi:hypothetical protein
VSALADAVHEFFHVAERSNVIKRKTGQMRLQLARTKQVANASNVHDSRALLHRLLWRELLERPPLHDFTAWVDGVAEDGRHITRERQHNFVSVKD